MPGKGMSFILYVVVLVVSVTSVMMGLDWLSTPPPPVPKSVQTVSAPAKPVAPVAAKNTASDKTESKTDSKQAAVGDSEPASSKPASATTGVAPNMAAVQPPAAAAPQSETAGSAPANAADDTAIMTESNVDAAPQAAAPLCDVQACAAHYRSFNPADCTYQPFDGPRRLCKVGNPPPQASDKPAATDLQTSDATKPAAPASCNYDACAAAYRSFDPATCTWQPFEGSRRQCTK